MFSRTFTVKNMSNSLTCTVASSCVCTSPLAVMNIVRLHDFVKVSISTELKSFLLMCIDAPESTTNSRSSSLNLDAGRHLFSEGEKNAALSCSCNSRTLLASFHGHLSLATLSSWDRSSNFGTHWGYADEVHLGKSFRTKDFGLECLRARRIGFRMSELFRKIDENFGGSISWDTQPSCRVFDESKTTSMIETNAWLPKTQWVLKISCKIGVLKQSQPALFRSFQFIQIVIQNMVWVHPTCTWLWKDVGFSKSTSLLSTFHIGTMFCFFPANFMSST